MAGIKLRDDYSAADLRRLARKARDGKQARHSHHENMLQQVSD